MPLIREIFHGYGVELVAVLGLAHYQMENGDGINTELTRDGVIVLAGQVEILFMPDVRSVGFTDGVVLMSKLIACHQQIQGDDGVAA